MKIVRPFKEEPPLFTATSLTINGVGVTTNPAGGIVTIKAGAPTNAPLQTNIECPQAQYNPYVVNDSAWNCIRVQGGGPLDANNAYCCAVMEFIPAPINAYNYFPQALPNGLSDRFKAISSYNAASKLASFNAYDCCDADVQKQWQRMIYWMLWARCGRQEVPGAIDYHPDTPCSQSQLAALAGGASVRTTTDIDPCKFTWYDNGVEKTTKYPEYSLPTNGTNYVWNYRMRRAMPELIATSNPGSISVTLGGSAPTPSVDVAASTGIDYLATTPPAFLYGVPYEVELLAGGSGYSRGGYFIYGNENCDLFEVRYSVSCGEVVGVELTKLAIDANLYSNLGAPIDGSTGKTKVLECEMGDRELYFNRQIPDIIEMNQIVLPAGQTHEYTYSWDGQGAGTRNQHAWFGGSGACIRIRKGYGFFSNLGREEKTNYASKTTNSRSGPSNNNHVGCLLSIPSCAEACVNNFGERRNSLNFSTIYQTNKLYKGTCNRVPPNSSASEIYTGKWQYDSQMKFYQQYPKLLNKEVACQYNFSTPSFNSTTTGSTPIIANYHTRDLLIYWTYQPSAPTWTQCRFNDIALQTLTPPFAQDTPSQQLIDASVLITKQAFPGYPLNIDGLWDVSASDDRLTTNGYQSGLTSAPGDTSWVWPINSGADQPKKKLLPTQCCAYEWEILPVTAPSIRPINNQLVPKSSTQEPSCWRINLRNLVVPNITLQSGSLASFYPYFYVEFSNMTEIGRPHGMVQSNNPNAKPALFRCAVTDIATPTISRFLKLSGDGMYQTVKFRPSDSLKIKVYLPDGRDFMTTLPDTAPPAPPNPLVQLSALFEVEKVD